MNHRERFLQIRDFLKPYQEIWQNEIMLMYPNPLDAFPPEWIDDLHRFQDKKDIIRLEKKDVFGLIQDPSLIEFYQKIKGLSALPAARTYPPMPEDPQTWLFITPKKQHEIRHLAPHINHLYQTKKIDQVVDIGGGIGLLAQTLSGQYQLKVASLDMDPVMQNTGKVRYGKKPKHPENQVQYLNVKVQDSGEFPELMSANVMPIGLHTCGKLALDIITVSSSKKVPVLVNFGCCYHKLDEAPGHQNISLFANAHEPLWLSQFALTLACRAHNRMNEEEYDFKIKVKHFRYAIHILLYENYGITELVTLGNSSPKLYDMTFADYVLDQFKRISLEPKHSFEELNAFFEKIKTLVEKMQTAGLIRDAFGRVLETYLLLDRAIYLEEQGYQVEVEEFFDEELSPRNIGITAILV